jgi:hypothetical protein
MGLFFKKCFFEAWIDLEGPTAGTDETSPLILLRRRSRIVRRALMFLGAQG